MGAFCREDEGLPDGYVARYVNGRSRLALCIKVHRGATAAECADVAEECGVDAGEESGPMPAEYGSGSFGGAWGLAWLEALAERRPEEYATLEGFARESSFEMAEADAREMVGAGVKLYTDGRCGGWLVLAGTAPDAEDARDLVSLAARDAGEAEPDEEERILAARATLAALDDFREAVAGYVADFPRAVAWQACANGFEPAAEAHRKAVALHDADAELQAATDELRRVADQAAPKPGEDDPPADELLGYCAVYLRAAVQRFDEARAKVAALESSGGAS